jgi:MFS family permease
MPTQIITRDFILCFLSQFTFNMAVFSLFPTLPIYLSRLGSTEVEIGILIAAFTVASLPVRPFAGRALIQSAEKKFMVAGSLFFAFSSAAYLIAPPFWPFLIVRIFQGIGFALFTSASFTLIANITPQDRRGQSFGYFILAFTLSGALGPPLGMILINHVSFNYLFVGCFVLSLFSLLLLQRLEKRSATPQDSFKADQTLLSWKAIKPAITGFFPFFIWGALTTFFPLYAIRHGMENPGLFFSVVAIMLVLGRVFGAKILDLYNRERLIMPCIAPYVISMAMLAFSETTPMFIMVAAVYGIGPAFLVPTLMAYALERGGAPGPAMATFNGVTDLGSSLGPAIMGTIIFLTDYRTTFLCLAVVGILNLIYFYFFARQSGRRAV